MVENVTKMNLILPNILALTVRIIPDVSSLSPFYFLNNFSFFNFSSKLSTVLHGTLLT